MILNSTYLRKISLKDALVIELSVNPKVCCMLLEKPKNVAWFPRFEAAQTHSLLQG